MSIQVGPGEPYVTHSVLVFGVLAAFILEDLRKFLSLFSAFTGLIYNGLMIFVER
jgi:hypothetical protein